ncbi:C40 family peptidase [Streptomyces niveus]|uniref:C40 family peptidase n=1 Tax=Streptomyces niveus TaxID=193462 RepID=UPI003642EC7D
MTARTKKWLWSSLGLVVIGLVLLSSVAAHVTGLGRAQASTASAPCGDAVGSGSDTAQVAEQVRQVLAGSTSDVTVEAVSLPNEQIPNAKVIVATGIQMNIPARGQVIALATALQESTLRNLTSGDRDSLGLFQQRPSQGWGTRAQISDPVYASTRFYNALKSVTGWEEMPLTQAAQRVQKSGFPDAYARHETLATALQQALAPTLSSESAARFYASGARTACTGQGDAEYGSIPAGTLPNGYQIPANASSTVRNAIRWALGQLGTPYQWGGSCTNAHGPNPRDRCDCSSLMQRAYGTAGIEISRTTYTQIHDGHPASAAALRPGDLVFTEGTAARPEHVSMFIGAGLVVHAPRPGRVVEVAPVDDMGQVLLTRRIAL